MIKLEKWTGIKTYMYPNGEIATPEKINVDFPAGLTFTHVIQTDHRGQVCFAFQNLSVLEDMYGIEESLSDEESIALIEEKMNESPLEPEPTAEERIAASLEYQNLMSM